MKRSALLICAGDDLPGAKQDTENLRAFLLSGRGGLWSPSEISILASPTPTQISVHLASARSADYSFVTFSGHGRYNVNRRVTELELRQGVQIDADDLKIGSARHTVIFDTCRVLHRTLLNETRVLKAAASAQFSETNSRQLFDRHLQGCMPGIVEIYSCDISETAGEESSGGWYTTALIGAAEQWGANARMSSVLSITEAHDRAAEAVQRKSGSRQNPKSGYPRSQPHFPFAVKG